MRYAWDKGNAYRILVAKAKGEVNLGDIKMNPKEMVVWIRSAFMNTGMNLWILKGEENVLTI
jgi:hypothetical protein